MSSSTPLQFNWYACPFQTAEDGAHDDVNATPAECADVAMPLCYPGVCTSTKTINVFVKRLLAINPPPDKQPRAMWMVQGGPGFGSPSCMSIPNRVAHDDASHGLFSVEPGLLDAYEAFNGTLSVYTIDHRGTGRSSILNCTSNGDQPKGNLNQWQALAKCHRQLKALYGTVPLICSTPQARVLIRLHGHSMVGETSGPIGFSVTSAAMDIATVIQAPTLFNGTDVFVYGVSFGTYTVARVMHLQPSNVKGYVLDSIQSEEFGTTNAAPYYSNWDRDVGDAVDQYFAHCDKDAFCASKLGQPSSKQALVDVYAALDAKSSPCYDVLAATANATNAATPSEYVGSTLYTMLGDKSTWSLIAPFIFRLRRCSQDDVDMFGNVTTAPNAMMQTSMMSTSSLPLFVLPPNRGSAYLKDEGFSAILYNLIVFSELWEFPAPTLETMAAATTSALFGLKNTKRLPDAFQELCVYIQNNDPVCQGYPAYESGAGFIYPRDKYWNKTAAVPPGASVLLLSGLMDPATPAKYARDQFVNMKGLDKLLLQFPFGGHGTLSTTPLADQ
ncbi:hypothetical protein DYB31_010109, partial [Aphanomyces astaci]